MTDDPQTALARRLGFVDEYTDTAGRTRRMGPDTRDALLTAMGQPTDADGASARLDEVTSADDARPLPLWQVVEADTGLRLDALDGRDWTLTCEDGTDHTGTGPDMGVIPLGIHRLRVGSSTAWLMAAPRRLEETPPTWGVTLPLYGLSPDGRIGTYADLAAAVASLGAAGAAFVGINPIHAGFTTAPDAISPYAPSHRGRLAAMHVAADGEAPLADQDGLIDYDTALPHRMAALRSQFDGGTVPEFDAWYAEADDDLTRFALHQAIAAHYGPYWPDWPAEYRDPTTDAVAQFGQDNAQEVAFHAWLQWRADTDLGAVQIAAEAAGMRFGLYLDLAVGTHPKGAETWGRPDLFAIGVSLGAPPDAFSSEGQSWGLAPLRPDTLAAEGFRPLAAILRRGLAHARLLRIDHILGFERAFWVPEDRSIPGGYVTMPREALLAVARIEAARAGATVVGEDLGNIPGGLQEALQDSGILGCRVVQFEQHWEAEETSFRPPSDYTPGALASFATHDLPTWLGWREGRDIEWRHSLAEIDDPQRDEQMATRNAEVAALDDRLGADDLDALHAFLADTPSRLVALQIEDLLGRVEQANLPGTVHDHPNWRRRLTEPAGDLGRLDAVRRASTIMAERGR